VKNNHNERKLDFTLVHELRKISVISSTTKVDITPIASAAVFADDDLS